MNYEFRICAPAHCTDSTNPKGGEQKCLPLFLFQNIFSKPLDKQLVLCYN